MGRGEREKISGEVEYVQVCLVVWWKSRRDLFSRSIVGLHRAAVTCGSHHAEASQLLKTERAVRPQQ